MLEYCSTCLNSDRRLTSLAALKPVLDSISWLQQLNVETDRVCWECRGVLARVQRFQRKVVRAQRALAEHRDSRRPALESLSTLSTYTVTYADESAFYEELVKHEADDDNDTYDYLDDDMEEVEEEEANEDSNSIPAVKQEKHIGDQTDSDDNEETNKPNLRKNKSNLISAMKQEKHIGDQTDFDDIKETNKPNLRKNKNNLISAKKQEKNIEDQTDSDDNEQTNKPNLRKNESNFISAMKQEKHIEDQTDSDDNEETNKPNLSKNTKGAIKAFDSFLDLIKGAEVDRKNVRIKEIYVSGENKGTKKTDVEGDEFVHLTKQEKKFIVTSMPLEEVHKLRELKSNTKHYKSSPFKCKTCLKCYLTEDQYKTHVRKFHITKLGRLVCTVCAARFSRVGLLRRHREDHFKRYRCRQCEFSHHRLATMILHANAQHQMGTCTCEFCGNVFPNMKRLSSHIEVMHRERALTCKRCKKTFPNKHELILHAEKVHFKGAPEECPKCGKMYINLSSHLKLMHAANPIGEDAYCAECGKQYRTVYTYRHHLRTHANHRQPGALQHPCPHCEKRFTSKNAREKHVASMHIRDFSFKCNSCDKSFNRDDHLRHHVKEKHLGIPRPKDKMCTICGRGFSARRTLTHHIRTHTGEKPYVCEHCGSAFAQKVALSSHMRNIHLKQGKTSEQ